MVCDGCYIITNLVTTCESFKYNMTFKFYWLGRQPTW